MPFLDELRDILWGVEAEVSADFSPVPDVGSIFLTPQNRPAPPVLPGGSACVFERYTSPNR